MHFAAVMPTRSSKERKSWQTLTQKREFSKCRLVLLLGPMSHGFDVPQHASTLSTPHLGVWSAYVQLSGLTFMLQFVILCNWITMNHRSSLHILSAHPTNTNTMQTNAQKHEMTLNILKFRTSQVLPKPILSWHALTTSAEQIGLEQQQWKYGPSLLGSHMHTWSIGNQTSQDSPGFSGSVLFLGSFLANTHAFFLGGLVDK